MDEEKGGLVAGVTDWFVRPFNTQGSALRWVLFVGLLIIAAFFWQLILLEITREA